MEPNHLKVKELEYELLIRRVKPSGDADVKRKLLRGALAQENANRSFVQSVLVSPLSYEVEVQEIGESIADLRTGIDSFTGSAGDAAHKRFSSRLTHLSGRIHRLCEDTAEREQKKQEFQMLLLGLEGDLAFKVVPSASTPQNAVAPQSMSAVTSHRSVPPYKWNLYFTGQSQKESVHSFLEKVEMLSRSRSVSEQELFLSAYDLFKGQALTWYNNIKHTVRSWDELVQKLKKDFLPYSYEEDLLREIDTRTQGQSEKVTLFIACMVGLFNRLSKKPEEKVIVNRIRRNLLPYFISQLALREINSVDELSDLCQKLEEAQMWTDKYRPPPGNSSKLLEPDLSFSKNFSDFRNADTSGHLSYSRFSRNLSAVNSSSIRCWNCDQLGHIFNNCRNRRSLFCFGCGEKNVWKHNCPRCQAVPKNGNSGGRGLDAVASTSKQEPGTKPATPSSDSASLKNKGKGKTSK